MRPPPHEAGCGGLRQREKKLVRRLTTKAKVATWIEQAKELPKVVKRRPKRGRTGRPR